MLSEGEQQQQERDATEAAETEAEQFVKQFVERIERGAEALGEFDADHLTELNKFLTLADPDNMYITARVCVGALAERMHNHLVEAIKRIRHMDGEAAKLDKLAALQRQLLDKLEASKAEDEKLISDLHEQVDILNNENVMLKAGLASNAGRTEQERSVIHI